MLGHTGDVYIPSLPRQPEDMVLISTRGGQATLPTATDVTFVATAAAAAPQHSRPNGMHSKPSSVPYNYIRDK